MLLEQGKYYHIYNRTNNKEPLFPNADNRLYFLNKIRTHILPHCTVIAYVLMPTHFHILVRFETDNSQAFSDEIAVLLRSYTKAINNRYNRHGNLFQQNTKAIEIEDEEYLLTLISYIHQNPIRGNLVQRLGDWEYSSYRLLAGMVSADMNNVLPIDLKFYRQYFTTPDDFIRYSEEIVRSVREKYWTYLFNQ